MEEGGASKRKPSLRISVKQTSGSRGYIPNKVSGVFEKNAHYVIYVRAPETLFQSLSEEDTDIAHSCTLCARLGQLM